MKTALFAILLSLNSSAWAAAPRQNGPREIPKFLPSMNVTIMAVSLQKYNPSLGITSLVMMLKEINLADLTPNTRHILAANALRFSKEVVKRERDVSRMQEAAANLSWMKNSLAGYLEPGDRARLTAASAKVSKKLETLRAAKIKSAIRQTAKALGLTRTEETPATAEQHHLTAREQQNAAADAVLKSYREDWDVATKGTSSPYFGATSRFTETAALFSAEHPNEGLQRAVVTSLVKEFRATSDAAYRDFLLRSLSNLGQKSIFGSVQKVIITGIMNRSYYILDWRAKPDSFKAIDVVGDIAVNSRNNPTKELAVHLLRRELLRRELRRVNRPVYDELYIHIINQAIEQIEKSKVLAAPQTPPASAAGEAKVGILGQLLNALTALVLFPMTFVVNHSPGLLAIIATLAWGSPAMAVGIMLLGAVLSLAVYGAIGYLGFLLLEIIGAI